MMAQLPTKVTIPARKALSGVTIEIEVSGLRQQRIRIAIGAWLLRAAAKVIGCTVDVSVPSEADLRQRRAAAREAIVATMRSNGVHRPALADACAAAALQAVGVRIAN